MGRKDDVMTDKDAIDMMRLCADEIRMLRAEIDRLAPKANAYDTLCQVLGLLPRPSQGYGPDLIWRLEKQISDMTKCNVEPPPTD
jgi:hypothetical protein